MAMRLLWASGLGARWCPPHASPGQSNCSPHAPTLARAHPEPHALCHCRCVNTFQSPLSEKEDKDEYGALAWSPRPHLPALTRRSCAAHGSGNGVPGQGASDKVALRVGDETVSQPLSPPLPL